MSHCFMPATTVMVVATKARDRWFDLDDVRTPVQHPDALATRKGKTATDDPKVSGRGLKDYDASMSAGAPPLDWWLVTDDDNEEQRPEGQPVSEAVYHIGDVKEVLASLDDNSVDLVLTSPPFLALRSYLPSDHPDKHKEIGSEPTPAEFLDTLLALTAEWCRVLTPYGSLCVELGDTYAGGGGVVESREHRAEREGTQADGGRRVVPIKDGNGWPLDKSLCIIPELYAACLAYGRNVLTGEPSPAGQLRVRNLVRWVRPNPPVGALGDKFRPATSVMTVAAMGRDRWFDLDDVRTPSKNPIGVGVRPTNARVNVPDDVKVAGASIGPFTAEMQAAGAPPLDWWNIPTEPYSGSHYATWPRKLCERPIRSMCPREVCTTCGEPRRRKLAERDLMSTDHKAFAHWMELTRRAAGVSFDDINRAIGRSAIAANYERTDTNGARIPSPADWDIIKPLIGAGDEFDFLIYGAKSTVEYVANGETVTTKRTAYGRGGGDGASAPADDAANRASRVAPDEWTDCGHGTYRRGVVLDPFAGSGTTLAVATGLGRDAIGIDLDARNADLAFERVGMFLTVKEG